MWAKKNKQKYYMKDFILLEKCIRQISMDLNQIFSSSRTAH